MLRFNEIKVGDYFFANHEGDIKLGRVSDFDRLTGQVCIFNGIQDFWYAIRDLSPVVLNEKSMIQLKFSKTMNEDGTIKYCKGAFRVLIPKEGDFTKMEIWYRDEHRHLQHPIHVHELQNHFKSMTNIILDHVAY